MRLSRMLFGGSSIAGQQVLSNGHQSRMADFQLPPQAHPRHAAKATSETEVACLSWRCSNLNLLSAWPPWERLKALAAATPELQVVALSRAPCRFGIHRKSREVKSHQNCGSKGSNSNIAEKRWSKSRNTWSSRDGICSGSRNSNWSNSSDFYDSSNCCRISSVWIRSNGSASSAGSSW